MKKLFGSYKPKWQQAMADPLRQTDNEVNELVSAARGQANGGNREKKRFSIKPKRYKPRWQQMMADPDINAIQEPSMNSSSQRSESSRRRRSRSNTSVGGDSIEDISSIGESTIDDTASVVSAASSTEMAFNMEEERERRAEVAKEAAEITTTPNKPESPLEKGSSNSTDTNTTLETTGSSNSSLEDPLQGGEANNTKSPAEGEPAAEEEEEKLPTRSGHSRNASAHSRSGHSSRSAKFVPPAPLWAPPTPTHTDSDSDEEEEVVKDESDHVRVRVTRSNSADDSEDSDIISVSTPSGSGADLSFTDDEDEDDEDEDDCSSASSESEALDKLDMNNNPTARPQKQRLNLGKRNNWKYVQDKNEILEWKLEKERTAQRNTRLENQKETLRQLRKVATLLDLPFAPVRPTEEECTTETMMFSIIQEGQLGEEESVSSHHPAIEDITFDMDDMDASVCSTASGKKARRKMPWGRRKKNKDGDDDMDASLGSHGSRKSRKSRIGRRRRRKQEEEDDDLSVGSASSKKSLGGRIAGRGRSISRTLSGGGMALRRSLSANGGLRKRLGKIGLRRSETVEC